MLTRPAGVVFDMDGLLLDSERLARETFELACERLGLAVDPEAYLRCVGSTEEDTARILTEVLASESAYRELHRHWNALYHERIETAPVALKAGALELLRALDGYGIPRALATSTRRPRATLKLERAGVLGYFTCLICGGETDRGKPYPDPYLAAVTALGTRPSETWALEDSEHGVRSARTAGLTVFLVPDLIAPGPALASLEPRVVNDLFEVLGELHRCCAAG
ncbi:MAG TPA: HAD family phosphatase [Pseudomonadales bacterium]